MRDVMIATLARRISFAFMTGGLFGAVAAPAHAERVISDYEAGKLTLESLTAAPAVHYVHRVSAHRAVSHAARGSRSQQRSLVHLASYHPKATVHAAAATRRRHHT
ncbi:hypothetical protein LOC54_04940 [Acetobacter sp. AN02]|uniref:hypothetical protein n=1 Tax=Acetobacter sp. AN02 TaxID=2894186 RepID=UPI00243429C2|nr:hypothetical protein [Acetobacter sp. AN02]MDG6094464.1 hypothetical protein [Acetobacter sp. AN02]